MNKLRTCKHREPPEHSREDRLKCCFKIQGGIVKSVQVSHSALGTEKQTENRQKKNKQRSHQQPQYTPANVKGCRHNLKGE